MAQDAGAIVNGAQAQLLAAMAQSGSAGAKAYNDAQAAIQSSRQGALADAQSRAGLVNMGSTNAAIQGIINAPIDRRLNDISQARASFQADQAARRTGASNYFSELSATLPLLAGLAKQSGELKANDLIARLQAAQSKQGELSDSEIRTRLLGGAQVAQDKVLPGLAQEAERAKATADNAQRAITVGEQAQGAPTGPPKTAKGKDRQSALERSGVGGWYNIAMSTKKGTPEHENAIKNIGRVAGSLQSQQGAYDTAQGQLADVNKRAEPFQRPLFEQARELGITPTAQGGMGLDPSRVYGLVGPAQEAAYQGAQQRLEKLALPVDDQSIARSANVTPQVLVESRKNPKYGQLKDQMQKDLESGMTWEEWSQNVRAAGSSKFPQLTRILLAEGKGLFPSAGANVALKNAQTLGVA